MTDPQPAKQISNQEQPAAPAPAAPAPTTKKFSAVNINKKFLEKNSAAAASSSAAIHASQVNAPKPALTRPTVQVTTAHISSSRLVTTKLTASPFPSRSPTSTGWSRPNSTAPTPPVQQQQQQPQQQPQQQQQQQQPSSGNPASTSPASSTGPPQLPHAGKVIHPQPRSAIVSNALAKSGSKDANAGAMGSKAPAWGSTGRPAASVIAPSSVPTVEFPTAAEVAQGQAKSSEPLPPPSTVHSQQSEQERNRAAEADTFRGVHLDPNAHHWDEMEEDEDDNFLSGVIAFGDGRQYTVPAPTSSSPPPTAVDNSNSNSKPVSKEDRFADHDFDRSWPPAAAKPEGPSASPTADHAHNHSGGNDAHHHPPRSRRGSTSSSVYRDRERDRDWDRGDGASRVLFNEKSNRLEPAEARGQGKERGGAPGAGGPSRWGDRDQEYRQQGWDHEQRPGGFGYAPRGMERGSSGSGRGGGGGSQYGRNGGPYPHSSSSASDRPPFDRHSSYASNSSRFSRGGGGGGADEHDEGYPVLQEKRRPGPPSTSSISREDRGSSYRGRKLSNMGPPPVPHHHQQALSPRESNSGRQLPPHLAGAGAAATGEEDNHQPRQRSLSPLEAISRRASSVHSQREPWSATLRDEQQHWHQQRPPSSLDGISRQSSLAHPSQQQEQGASSADAAQAEAGAVDIDKLSKEAMHDAAERARIRRQQEEEAREAERERARKKAAELEAKMAQMAKEKENKETKKTEETKKEPGEEQPPQSTTASHDKDGAESVSGPKAVTDSEVDNFIKLSIPNGAAPGASTPSVQPAQAPSHMQRQPSERSLSSRGGPRQRLNDPTQPRPAYESLTSWRSTARPLASKPPPSERSSSFGSVSRQASTSQDANANHAPTITVSKLPELHSATAFPAETDDGEVLEVFEFSEMGKMVGKSSPETHAAEEKEEMMSDVGASREEASQTSVGRSPRPIASDFFDLPSSAPAPSGPGLQATTTAVPQFKSDVSSPWRRRQSISSSSSRAESNLAPLTVPHHGHVPPQRSPRSPNYSRKSQIAAFDDAILRIKDAMHHDVEPVSVTAAPSKTAGPSTGKQAISPSSASATNALNMSRKEGLPVPDSFAITSTQVPRSPKSAWRTFKVSMPAKGVTPPREPVLRRQVNMMQRTNGLRLTDTLSFRPPVEGMGRDLSLFPILFPIPRMEQGRMVYPVSVPKKRLVDVRPELGAQNGYARDGMAAVVENGLDTMSRSPPPEVSTGRTPESGAVKFNKPQPKMPMGSGVAFYRDSPVESSVAAETKSSLRFVVSSELDGSSASTETSAQPKEAPTTVLETINEQEASDALKSQPTSPSAVPSLLPGSNDTHGSTDSDGHQPLTPLTTWTKSPIVFPLMESPARAPDPEHIKAVWSQSRDKTESNPINSLQAIADDLPVISFSLQEVKSEDGGTPPPSVPAVSSRMSLHDVTKAFQQVPSSSSSSSTVGRTAAITPMSPSTIATASSSSTATPPVRPPPSYSYALPHPMSNPAMRPPYASYPSMVSHHPPNAANVMYPPPMAPSPVHVSGHHGPPLHMNGQATPMYPGTPMWVAMPPLGAQGPPPPNGLVRPLASPYPPQMMAYPSPSGQPVYASMPMPPPPQASRAPSQTQQQAPPVLTANGRGRGNILPSPALSHASPVMPMYTASPVLMHSPMVPNAQAVAAAAAHQYMSSLPPPVGGRGAPHLVNSAAAAAAAAAAANAPSNAQTQAVFTPGAGYQPRPSW